MNTHSFWGHVNVKGPDECWEWKAKISSRGYGQPTTVEHRKIATTAHRVAYILTNGKVGEGIKICHSCDNPKCCNPKHLWAGSNQENMLDCKEKGRTTKGVKSGMAKLSADQVIEIRKLGGTCKRLSAIYGVSGSTISRVVRGVHY